jgi:hypothetical protein
VAPSTFPQKCRVDPSVDTQNLVYDNCMVLGVDRTCMGNMVHPWRVTSIPIAVSAVMDDLEIVSLIIEQLQLK